MTEKIVMTRSNEDTASMFGAFDINVRLIEKAFDVKIANRGEADSQQVCDRLCKIDSKSFVADKTRHNVYKRQKKNEFSHHSHRHRRGSIAQGDEGHLAGYLYTEEQHSAKIYAQHARGV